MAVIDNVNNIGVFQQIIYNEGGKLYLSPRKLLTSPTIDLYDGEGNQLVDGQSCSFESIDTTLSASASKGDTTISVGSATGMSFGSPCWLSSQEEVIVKSVSGTTITLLRPLIYDHASGNDVKSWRIYYSVSSSEASRKFLDGYAIWYDSTEKYAMTPVCCTKYPIVMSATVQDVMDKDVNVRHKLGSGEDLERGLYNAWKEVISRIESTGSARYFLVGGMELTNAVVYAYWYLHYEPKSDEASTVLYERYDKRTNSEIKKLADRMPRDTDEDGITNEDGERLAYGTVTLSR